MLYKNVYFITGNAYAGKSTMVRKLAEKYHGIQFGENYHNSLLEGLNKEEQQYLFQAMYHILGIIHFDHVII